MNQEEQDKQDLRSLSEALKTLDVQNIFLDKDFIALPSHLLSVPCDPDKQNRDMSIILSFYPIEQDADFAGRYLQFYCQLPAQFNEQGTTPVLMFIPQLNTQVPLGHFGFRYQDHKMYYRYVLLLGQHEQDYALKVAEVINMMQLMLDMVDPSIQLLEKNVPIAEIISQFEQEIE